MIRVRDLSVGYEGRPVLERLDFEVRRGDIFLILGGSGSGKSTLMRNMIGLQEPLRGEVEIEGARAELGGAPPPFGVLFQSSALLGSMTVGENIGLALDRWTDLDAETVHWIVRSKLRLVGLDGFENYLPSELSGGM
jgi:phospholipid/cholesterol/gamma-HCH transport system ATP-binding protein